MPVNDLDLVNRLRTTLICSVKSFPQGKFLDANLYRCVNVDLFETMWFARLVAQIQDLKSVFLFKISLIWFSTPTHLPLFNAICRKVSRRLRRIGEEETGYHKPFSFDLKEVVSAK